MTDEQESPSASMRKHFAAGGLNLAQLGKMRSPAVCYTVVASACEACLILSTLGWLVVRCAFEAALEACSPADAGRAGPGRPISFARRTARQPRERCHDAKRHWRRRVCSPGGAAARPGSTLAPEDPVSQSLNTSPEPMIQHVLGEAGLHPLTKSAPQQLQYVVAENAEHFPVTISCSHVQ
jgi:hypothetical protein